MKCMTEEFLHTSIFAKMYRGDRMQIVVISEIEGVKDPLLHVQ